MITEALSGTGFSTFGSTYQLQRVLPNTNSITEPICLSNWLFE